MRSVCIIRQDGSKSRLRYGAPTLAALLFTVCPLSAQSLSANDILNSARLAMGGPKLAAIHSLTVWGANKRGGSASMMTLSVDLPGKFLQERTTLGSGGEIGRTVATEDGFSSGGGGMPGDSGGPELSSYITECLTDGRYWGKLRSGPLSGSETQAAARQRNFTQSFVLYMLALTLSPPPKFPMTFTYGERVDAPGGKADGIEGKGPEGFAVRIFIDTKTHLPLMIEYHDGPRDIQMWLKDQKAEDGVVFPHTIDWIADGNPIEEFRLQKFKINPKFNATVFEK